MVNRNLWLSTLIMVPTIDSIQEFRVLTSNYSAEYGSAAGAVTVVLTKSGTNQLHGSAYEFLRNDKLDANTFFNNLTGAPKPGFRRNEFGGTVGGAIHKDKTFFFLDYQGIRLAEPQTITSTIPTVAERNMILTGNFSGLGTTIYDPVTATGANGTARVPFGGNIIPSSRLDPAAVKIAGLLPTPTTSGATRNFTYDPTITQQTDQYDVRIDQNLGASDRLFGKYSFDNTNQLTPGLLPSPANAGIPISPYLSANGTSSATSVPLRNQSLTLDYTKVLSATTINEARAGVVRWNEYINPIGNAFDTATALGIPGININNKSGGLPAMTISGFQVIGDNSTFPESSQMTLFQYDDSMTLVRGNHTFKFGGAFIRDRFNGFSEFPARGSYTFNGQFTRQTGASTALTALSDFALGAPSAVSRNILNGEFGMRFWSLNAFAQDAWRVTNRLTLTYGLRYEINAPPRDIHDHWSNLNLDSGQLVLAGQNGNSAALRNIYWHAFAPRLGVAYMLTSDRKTVLRSGFGISYVEPGKGGGQLYKNLPNFFSQVVSTDQNGVPPLYLSNGLPAPVPPDPANIAQLSSGNPTAWDFDLKPARAMQWSLGIERELAQNLMLDVAYVGTRTLDLVSSYNYNQPYPGAGAVDPRRPLYSINPLVGNITYNTNFGSAKYNGLQVKLEKRYSSGLTLTAAYTYSSYLGDASNINGGGVSGPQDARCFTCIWGPMADDLKHVLVINHEYEVPFGAGRKYLSHGWVGQIVGDWNINGIWSVNSGQRVTPTLASSVSNAPGGGGDRPNRISNGSLSSGQTIDQWFDVSAFVAPAQYTFGNAGTGIIVGPGYFNVDVGIHRNFPIKERFTISYRCEMFNSFNRANFGTPNASIGNALAGQISGTGPARVIQMALKVIF
ncbi:MAG: TonB-dependent receptor domain-containing protein, partial [Bryobacteraceae bacterium]